MTAPRNAIRTLAVLLFLPALANAQELPVLTRTAASCQFDSAAIRDTIDFTLFLSPPRSVAKARSRREQYTPYIAAIASTFEQPRRCRYPTGRGTGPTIKSRARAR